MCMRRLLIGKSSRLEKEMLRPPSCCPGKSWRLRYPLAAMTANSINVVDIALWGIAAIILQFIAIVAARLLISQLVLHIMRGDIAAAVVLAVGQIAAGPLNAAALSS
jgi:uncharacterized membrane protein YjfL (UPF0719 family)